MKPTIAYNVYIYISRKKLLLHLLEKLLVSLYLIQKIWPVAFNSETFWGKKEFERDSFMANVQASESRLYWETCT